MQKYLNISTFLTLSIFMMTTQAMASDCNSRPSCTKLGYTQSKSDCGDYNYLPYPWESSSETKGYCGEVVGGG